jgi:hypothetical protein
MTIVVCAQPILIPSARLPRIRYGRVRARGTLNACVAAPFRAGRRSERDDAARRRKPFEHFFARDCPFGNSVN